MSDLYEQTTWDGKPVARQPPFGATVVVYRHHEESLEFLVLHRAHGGPQIHGEWAWTPPSGARYPGENIEVCARRELLEETGLELEVVPVDRVSSEWRVFTASLDRQPIRLSQEHDEYQWVHLENALQMCKPHHVASAIEAAARALGLT